MILLLNQPVIHSNQPHVTVLLRISPDSGLYSQFTVIKDPSMQVAASISSPTSHTDKIFKTLLTNE